MDPETALALLWGFFSLAWMATLILFTAMEYPTDSNAARVQRQIERESRRRSLDPLSVLDRKRRQTLLSATVLRLLGLLAVPVLAYLTYRNLTTLGRDYPAAFAASTILGMLLVGGLFYISFVARHWIPPTLDRVRQSLATEPRK